MYADVTADTTGKVSSLHDLTYRKLRSSFGEETVRLYGEANEAAVALVGSRSWLAAASSRPASDGLASE